MKNKDIGQFPFLNMVGGKSINLTSTITEAEGMIDDISTLINQTEAEMLNLRFRKKYKKNIKLKIFEQFGETNKTINEHDESKKPFKEIKITQSHYSKPILPSILKLSTLNTSKEASFEKLIYSPIKKLNTCKNSIDMSKAKPSSTRVSFNKTCLLRLPTKKSNNNSKYQAIDNSINEIMQACNKFTISKEDEGKKEFLGKFPEIDFLKNIIGPKRSGGKNGIFIQSGKDMNKYLSLEKDNIFQMCHYMNIITPKQSYSNRELYMSRFGMKK
jgi:hypothetical protein